MADQQEAARYAEATLRGGHTLSRLLLDVCPLRSGRFEWSVEPTVGSPGDWYMPGVGVSSEALGIRPLERLVSHAVRGDDVVVLEDAMIGRDRAFVPKIEPLGIRALFKAAGDGDESFLVIDSGRPESLDAAFGRVGGAHRFVGAMTAVPLTALPSNGADVADETLRAIAEAATHVFFRGPSYDGLVVWTAPGREA